LPFFDDGSGVGIGIVLPAPPHANTRPEKEYVLGAPAFVTLSDFGYVLSYAIDDLTRELGPRVWWAMLKDPAVASSYNPLKMGIIADGLALGPVTKLPAWASRKSRPPTAASVREDELDSLTPIQRRALEIYDFDRRLIHRLGAEVDKINWQIMDAMALGSKMAEPLFELHEEGEDAGKMVWKTVHVKPNWAWRFVCDRMLNVLGFLSFSLYGVYEVYDVKKFAWVSWMPRDNDPRGQSILNPANNGWNLKTLTWPIHYQNSVRFGSPSLDYELAEGDTADRIPLDANGNPIPNAKPVPATVYAAQQLQSWKAGGIFCRPNGGDLNVIEPTTPGDALLSAFNLYNHEITLGIECQTRDKLEAEHGSKADSDGAQDRRELIIQYGRGVLAGFWRTLLHKANELNFGKEDADTFTPYPSFGTDATNKPALWRAASSLVASGYIGESQKEELDAEMGLPVRDAAADRAAIQAQQEAEARRALELQAARKPVIMPDLDDEESEP
jgi:hypothetical protein